MKSLVLAHLSDLHISRFGGGITQMRGLARAAQEKGWEPVRQDAGWSIDVWRAEQSTFRRLDWLRLVDDAGVVQREVKLRDRPEQEVVDELLELMEFRIRVSAATLAKGLPGMNQVAWLLDKDPTNVNVRFCAVAHQLRADNPDWVLITGDLTDDGDGYDLLLEGLAPFVESGRLVCIPGNHDIYASPPLVTAPSQRRTLSEKRRLWATFATSLGLPPGGCYVHNLGEGVLLACLDSCHPARLVTTASGWVQPHELDQLMGQFEVLDSRGDTLRLAMVHHHIVNPPIQALGATPIQTGMRLRNAREVLEYLKTLRIEVIMNGHRHLGYKYQIVEPPLFLSAPSTTRGGRSGDAPYYWRLEVSRKGAGPIQAVPIQALSGLHTALLKG